MGYHNGNVTAGYHADATWTTIQTIALPSDWNAQAGSEDMIYAISNNKLYAYNRVTYLYEMKYTLPAFTKFSIRSIGGRILVWGITTTIVSNISTTSYQLTS